MLYYLKNFIHKINKTSVIFGICLGMQAAVVEYCRNKLGRPGANSAEFDENLAEDYDDAIIFMPEGDRERMGGTICYGRNGFDRPGF